MLEELGRRLLNELVGDGFLRLVLIGGYGRERRDDEHEAVLDILEIYLRVGLEVFSVLFYICVYLRHKRGAYSLIGCAAVFEVARVMIILLELNLIREAERGVYFKLIFGLIRSVASDALAAPSADRRNSVVADDLLEVVGYAVFVEILERFKLRAVLISEHEFDARVDYRLAASRS